MRPYLPWTLSRWLDRAMFEHDTPDKQTFQWLEPFLCRRFSRFSQVRVNITCILLDISLVSCRWRSHNVLQRQGKQKDKEARESRFNRFFPHNFIEWDDSSRILQLAKTAYFARRVYTKTVTSRELLIVSHEKSQRIDKIAYVRKDYRNVSNNSDKTGKVNFRFWWNDSREINYSNHVPGQVIRDTGLSRRVIKGNNK